MKKVFNLISGLFGFMGPLSKSLFLIWIRTKGPGVTTQDVGSSVFTVILHRGSEYRTSLVFSYKAWLDLTWYNTKRKLCVVCYYKYLEGSGLNYRQKRTIQILDNRPFKDQTGIKNGLY